MLHHPWVSVCCITPGKLCVGSLQGNYLLHQPWETMCCLLWSSAFGSPALAPSFGALFWAPVLGRQGPWPLGPVCVASPLGNYVLDHSWETMCWITPWCVGSQCSQAHRPSNKKHTRGHVGQSKPGTLS